MRQPDPIDAGIFAHQVRVTLDNRLAILVNMNAPAAVVAAAVARGIVT